MFHFLHGAHLGLANFQAIHKIHKIHFDQDFGKKMEPHSTMVDHGVFKPQNVVSPVTTLLHSAPLKSTEALSLPGTCAA